jgi:hypothetical protein
MIKLTTVVIETTDPVELFSATDSTNFAFVFTAGGQPYGSPLLSANADGSNPGVFEFSPMSGVVGTGYLSLPEQWLPTMVQVVAWNTD